MPFLNTHRINNSQGVLIKDVSIKLVFSMAAAQKDSWQRASHAQKEMGHALGRDHSGPNPLLQENEK